MAYLVFDIGGTNLRVGISKDGKGISDYKTIATPQAFITGIDHFADVARELSQGEEITAMAGGFPGPTDPERGVTLAAPHLEGWAQKSLRTELQKKFGDIPVYIENDTEMVGLGEAHYGAGRGYDIVAYITVSTGVGGARITSGVVDEHSVGFEPGHQIVDIDGPRYLEDIISGSALQKKHGIHPKDIMDTAVWDEVAKNLAAGLNNLIVHWSPDVIVLGGGMLRDPKLSMDRIREYTREYVRIFPELPSIERAQLGDIGGLWGSLVYLLQQDSV